MKENESQFEGLFNSRHQKPGDIFMDLLEKEKLVVAPGVYDAMGAHIARQIYLDSKEKISLVVLMLFISEDGQ